MIQAQLLHIALNEKDVVYTPDDVARDVVAFFKPTGKILEPSKGDGAFLKWLPPDTDWCEITEGRDFFAEHRHFDWIVGNPPFSIFYDWLKHSFEIAEHVGYVIPLGKVYAAWRTVSLIRDYGGVHSMLMLGTGRVINFELGFAIAAVHFQRGYLGGTFTYFRGV